MCMYVCVSVCVCVCEVKSECVCVKLSCGSERVMSLVHVIIANLL